MVRLAFAGLVLGAASGCLGAPTRPLDPDASFAQDAVQVDVPIDTGAFVLLGDPNAEIDIDAHGAGTAEASSFVAAADGTVTSLSVRYDSGDATRLLVALYSDAGGHPGQLLTSGTIDSTTGPLAAGQWYTASTTSAPVVSVTHGTVYWITLVCPLGPGRSQMFGTTIAFPYHYTGASGTCGPALTSPCTEHSGQTDLEAWPTVWTNGAQFPPSFNSFYATHD